MADRAERDSAGMFVAEGRRLCEDAVAAGTQIHAAYCTQKQSGDFDSGGAPVYLIADALAEKIGDTKSPQGIFLLCGTPQKKIFAPAPGGKYLMLHGLQDPGNVGAVIRSAEALGMDALLLDRSCPDVFSPKVLRAGMGGSFRLACHIMDDTAAAVRGLRGAGAQVFAAALTEGAAPLPELRFPGTCAVLIGNEGSGLPGELIGLCDAAVSIPMRGAANSLNAAAAAAILIWEMTKHDRVTAI